MVQDPHLTRLDKGVSSLVNKNYDKFTQKDYANDLIFDELLNFVNNNKEKPFFLMWTTPLPHVSLQAPRRWVDYYIKKFGDEKPYLGEKGYLPCRYPRATYAAMISYFDEQVGILIDVLNLNQLQFL
jgi:arylsulfatase